MARPDSLSHTTVNRFQQLLNCYEEGNITDTELNLLLMQAVTEENVGDISTLPQAYLKVIRNYLHRQPTTEENWGKMRFFAIIMWGREVTAEYVDNYWKEQHRKHRCGVEILRRYFKEVEISAVYHNLVITAADPAKDIWLSDDENNLVERGHGVMTTSLLPGKYMVRFGLMCKDHPIELDRDLEYHQEDE